MLQQEKLIVKQNLSEETYNRLVQLIARSNYSQGDKMPSESHLTQMLGVSRSTVRTALSKLTALGVVEPRQGDGYYICANNVVEFMDCFSPSALLNAQDFLEIMEFRRGIEPEAVRQAALHASPSQLDEMERIIKLCEIRFGDTELFSKSDMDVHLVFAQASHNKYFIECMQMVKNTYAGSLSEYIIFHGVETGKQSNIATAEAIYQHEITSHDYHIKVYKAIRNRDPDMAEKVMRGHVDNVANKLRADIRHWSNRRKSIEV
ncbi:MAG: FadR/GntR family transcriptional regulator [Angelakisella sp.]|nr:FadR/GntR family transcriptional regulator [Angelakisella sp.]